VIVYRVQLSNGFATIFGERYDGLLSLAIVEHWYNVFSGVSPWRQTFYYYPAANTLSYSEALAGLGFLHAVFRAAGFDPFLATELAALVFKVLGFFTFYWMARRSFELPMVWSLLGSTLFTVASNLFLGMIHTQFVVLSLAPLIVALLTVGIEALYQGRTWRWMGSFMAASTVFALCLATCFYVAWYFAFFAVVASAIYLVTGGKSDVQVLVIALKSKVGPLLAVLIWGFLNVFPFFYLYLPMVRQTGGHSVAEVLTYAPPLPWVLNITSTNFVWAGVFESLGPDLQHMIQTPVVIGLPPIFLITALVSLVIIALWRPIGRRDRVLRAVALACLVTWPLAIRYGDWTPWELVYRFFPGASGIRVTLRYHFFLVAPLTLVAVGFLAKLRLPMIAVIPLAAVLVAEEIDSAAPVAIDRIQEVARLKALPLPPAECKSFYASKPREGIVGEDAHGIYSHNVDAMVIAEVFRIPTLNGFGTFTPPSWNLKFPSAGDYSERVAAYAVSANLIEGLCALDLATQQWNREYLSFSQ
jgi:hypothetical protein